MGFREIGQESHWNNWLIESLPTLVLRLRISSAKVKKVEYLRPGHLFAILLLRKWDIQGFQ